MKKRWSIIVCLTVSFALALALSTMLTGTPAAIAFDSPLPKPGAFLPHVTKQRAVGSPHNLPGNRVYAEGNPAP
jgi:hypothetical protein